MSLFGFLRRNKDDDGYEADDDNDVWVVDKYDGEEYLLLEWEDGYWYYEKDDSVTLFFQESANETPVRFGSFAYDDNGFPDLESRLTDVEDDDDDDDDYEDDDYEDDEDDEDDVPYEDDEGNWAVIDKYDGAEYILLELDDEHWYYKKSDSAVVFLQESDDEDIPPVRLGSYAYNDEGLPDLDSDPLTDAEDDDDDDEDDDEDDEDAAYQDDDGNWAALDENGEQHQLTNCFDGFWYYQQIGSLSLFQESDGGIPVRLGSIPILDDSEVVPPQPVAYDVGDY